MFILAGDFQQYDFGPAGNFQNYGQMEAPLYQLQKITTPVALIYGKNDAIVTVEVMRPFDDLCQKERKKMLLF